MTGARLRLSVIASAVVSGAAALLAWTQPWFDLLLAGGESGAGTQTIAISGQVATPALSALGLASLALAAALSIARPVLRAVLGAIEIAIGTLIVVVAISAISSPVTASAAAVTDATGISGPESIDALVASVAMSEWPWLAVAAGLGCAAAGIAVLVSTRRWPRPTARYDTATTDEAPTAVGAWDALSEGTDPTERSPGDPRPGDPRPGDPNPGDPVRHERAGGAD